MGSHGKKFEQAKGLVESRPYGLEEAIQTVRKAAFAKFAGH